MLMSVIAGEAVAALRDLDDKQVLQQCMATLRELFKEQVSAASGGGRPAQRCWVGPGRSWGRGGEAVSRVTLRSSSGCHPAPRSFARAAVTRYHSLRGVNSEGVFDCSGS